MSEKIFKGFKQVTIENFNSVEDKSGYLWFVRTGVSDGEGVNDVSNDEYDIYFGSRHYGHFCEGELSSIKEAIEQTNGDIVEILSTLDAITTAIESNTEAISTNRSSIEELKTNLQSFLIKNIDSNDKVLSVADGILSSNIELVYEDSHIKLYGKTKEVTRVNDEGEEITENVKEELGSIDASIFIKDSVLESVDVVEQDGEKYLEFSWNIVNEDGETKTDRIKISDFAKIYSAGVGIGLDENDTFNVKIAENDNFLSVNGNNELIVDDVTTDKTMLKESITIEGGPLASDAVKSAFANGVIPAGTDIQSILKALLCVEIYPDTYDNTTAVTYTATITAPSVGSDDVKNNDLVEIGQVITFKEVTAKKVSVNSVAPTVSGFTHGYSDTLTGDTINTGTSISGEWSIKQNDEKNSDENYIHVYELSASVTGFTGTPPTTVQAYNHSECKLSSCSLTAVSGTNVYSVTEDAPKYIGSCTGVDSKYIVSNLNGRSESHKSQSISGIEDLIVDPVNKTGKITVTGVYPVYTNGVVASVTTDNKPSGSTISAEVTGDGTKLPLMKSGDVFVVSFASQGVAPYRLFLPPGSGIKSAFCTNPLTGKFETDCLTDFVTNGTTKRNVQGTDVTYTIYEWDATQGADYVKFVLK